MILTPPKKGGGTGWSAVADPAAAEHIPGLRQFGGKLWGPVDAMAVLKERLHADAEVPGVDIVCSRRGEPISLAADFRDYQRSGIQRLVGSLQADGGCLLADDMGLGKTLQTVGTWHSLKRPVPLLVVAPATVRRGWVREFKKWAQVDARLVETGAQAKAVTNADKVIVTSYELARKLPPTFCPHMLVMDEAHLVRGRTAKRSQHLIDLAKMASYKLALTGTPMWSRPRDFWMILKILFGYRFGTADEFDFAYCGASINQWGGKENRGATRLGELRKRLAYVMLRRTKEDVKQELPDLTRQVRWVAPTKAATKALEASALKQISLTDALNATLDSKIDAAVEAAVEAGSSLVFTWQKRHAGLLAEKIAEEGLQVELITGDYTHAEREAAIDRAIENQATVVATIDSTNAGVDRLQFVASTVIFHALDYTPIKMAQAEARLHRIGQKNTVTVVYLAMEDSADSYVVDVVVDKLDQWKASMGSDGLTGMGDTLGAPNMKKSEEEALAAIFAAMENEE